MGRRRKKRPRKETGGIRLQLIILGTTGLLMLGMAIVMVVHKPFITVEVAAPTPPPVVKPVVTTPRAAVHPLGGGPVEPNAILRANLRSLLVKLGKTHAPYKRKRLLEKARKRLEEFEPFLIEILANEDDELILEAIALVGEFQMGSAALDLMLLTDAADAQVKAAAIRNFELLRPWPLRDLRRFLKNDPVFPTDPAILRAGLEVCSWREDRPLDLIIPLLGHSDDRVRIAAVGAIGELASGDSLDALCAFAVQAFGLRAQAAARALGGTGLTEEAEAALIQLLKKESWMVVEAALAALSTKESLLMDAEPILAIVADRKRSVRERIYGFIALENTGTVPVERIADMLPGLHPILQLLGARCLITAGDSSGIERMIDLLATETSETIDGDERDCVRAGAASVLVEVAGEDLGDSEAWREWSVGLEELPPCQLETPAPTLW